MRTLLFCVLTACSSGGDTTPPVEAGSDASSGPDVSGPTTKYVAEVMVIDELGYFRASGIFREANGILYNDDSYVDIYGCVTVTKGACFFRDNKKCLSPPDGPDVSAGAITLANAGATFDLTPSGTSDIRYADTSIPSLTWAAGETMAFGAAGSPDVPAFTGKVTMPPKTTVTAPVASATIDRTQALAVAWASVPNVSLHVVVTDHTLATAVCDFPGTAATGSIPPEVLTGLAPGGGTISITTMAKSAVVDGDWTVDLVVRELQSAGGGQATIQ